MYWHTILYGYISKFICIRKFEPKLFQTLTPQLEAAFMNVRMILCLFKVTIQLTTLCLPYMFQAVTLISVTLVTSLELIYHVTFPVICCVTWILSTYYNTSHCYDILIQTLKSWSMWALILTYCAGFFYNNHWMSTWTLVMNMKRNINHM